MPSHIYIRTGNYNQGIKVNEASINGYNTYLSLFADVQNNAFLYQMHNLHLQAACAMMNPNYAFSMQTAQALLKTVDTAALSMQQPFGNAIQYIYSTPVFVNVRYGKWEKIIATQEVAPAHAYANVLLQWAKGLAYANSGNFSLAKERLATMQKAMKSTDLEVVMEPFNAAISPSRVAEKILEGTIALKQGDKRTAINFFKKAVQLEDDLIYSEPRDWLLPSRHYLADALIKARDFVNAKKILQEELAQNPHNFFSLFAMRTILPSTAYEKAFKSAYKNSDLGFPALIY
jgi:tetratricopeptide (TPR) repeat protein